MQYIVYVYLKKRKKKDLSYGNFVLNMEEENNH